MTQSPNSETKKKPKQLLLLIISALTLPVFMLGASLQSIDFPLMITPGEAATNINIVPFIAIGAFFGLIAVSGSPKTTFIIAGAAALFGLTYFPVESAGPVGSFFSAIGIMTVVGTAFSLKKYYALLAVPVGYGLTFLVCGDPILAIGSLVFLPPAAVMGFMIQKGRKQSGIVTGVAVCLCAILALAVAAILYTTTGKLSVDNLAEIISAERDALIKETMTAAAQMEIELDEEMLTVLVNTVIGILPAIIILLFEVMIYPAVRMCIGIQYRFGNKKPSTETMVLRLETVSAIIFFASFLVSLFGNNVVSLAAENIYLLLMPAFALVEAISILAKMRLGLFRIRPVFLILLLLFVGSFLPTILAAMGAYHTIVSNRLRAKGEHPYQ